MISTTQVIPKITCDNTTEFECQDTTKRCIPREWVLDGQSDCKNSSDENSPLPFCTSSEFACPVSRRCVPRYRVNDGFPDCSSRADENLVGFECRAEEFDCGNKNFSRCIPYSWVNNNLQDCSSGKDENRLLLQIFFFNYTFFKFGKEIGCISAF